MKPASLGNRFSLSPRLLLESRLRRSQVYLCAIVLSAGCYGMTDRRAHCHHEPCVHLLSLQVTQPKFKALSVAYLHVLEMFASSAPVSRFTMRAQRRWTHGNSLACCSGALQVQHVRQAALSVAFIRFWRLKEFYQLCWSLLDCSSMSS